LEKDWGMDTDPVKETISMKTIEVKRINRMRREILL
jgi:hypothetical protein